MLNNFSTIDKTDERDELVIPNRSSKRLVSWVVSRFGLRQRKIFWVWITSVSLAIFCSSGIMLNAFIRTPLYFFANFPVIGPWVRSFTESDFGVKASEYIVNTSQHSLVDISIREAVNGVWAATTFPNSNFVVMSIGMVAILMFLVSVIKLMASPSNLLMTRDYISQSWGFWGLQHPGPAVPWSEVIGIRLRRDGGVNSIDGKIDIIYSNPRLLYAMISPANAANENRFTIDLETVDSLETRQRIGEMLERYAPPNTVSLEVAETLSATQSNSYTELWLQALTAPSKRESLEPLAEGKQLRNGAYRIAGQLGVGGQGTAYIAEYGLSKIEHADADVSEPGHKLSLVVKEFVLPLYVDSNSRKAALRSFLDEAALLKKLDHKRVVKLNDCFVEDHRGYLVMERIHGESLKNIVTTRGALTESRVIELLHQMLDVLGYLHSQSPPVVHRDFAPDNLILGEDDVLKLVDFNVAQQAENTMTGTIVGKQSYVPPEQLRGMATPASDIYAMGATLHFLLTGYDPEPLSVSHPKEIAPHVTTKTDNIVARCTSLDSADRFNSVSEIQDALRSLSGLPT